MGNNAEKIFVTVRGEKRKVPVASRFFWYTMQWMIAENLSASPAAIPLSLREQLTFQQNKPSAGTNYSGSIKFAN